MKIRVKTPAKGTPGRQHLIYRTVGEILALTGADAEIAVSQASLRKVIGSAGLARLLEADREKIARTSANP